MTRKAATMTVCSGEVRRSKAAGCAHSGSFRSLAVGILAISKRAQRDAATDSNESCTNARR